MATPPSNPSHIPDKLFFRIGEVSRIADVPASVLRFWENEFPRIKPRRTETGQRIYRKSDVELILTIKHLLYDRKFTIKGARQHLKSKAKTHIIPEPSPSPPDTDLISSLRNELRQIRDLLT